MKTELYGSIEDGRATSGADHKLLNMSPSFFHSAKITVKSRMAESYDPENWFQTVGAVVSHSYFSSSFLWISFFGCLSVVISSFPIFAVESRTCRAWCSHIALGPQAHTYIGLVLFLTMAFRNNTAVNNYQSGLRSFYAFKTAIRSFLNTLLNRIPRGAIAPEVRARALSLITTFPYAVMLDLREQRVFGPNTIEGVLSDADLVAVQNSPTLPVYIIEELTKLVTEINPVTGNPTANSLHASIGALMGPYVECEKIKQNPCMLSYVAHMRAFLVGYLVTLPLTLVETMGWVTMPVLVIITWALLSLEMLSVDVENPFDGQGRSDLRLRTHCQLIKEQALESWQRWMEGDKEEPASVTPYIDAVDPDTQVCQPKEV